MEEALLASTNVGGENVARGACLGALFGAAHGMEGIPKHLIDGLHDRAAIATAIEAFLEAIPKLAAEKAEL